MTKEEALKSEVVKELMLEMLGFLDSMITYENDKEILEEFIAIKTKKEWEILSFQFKSGYKRIYKCKDVIPGKEARLESCPGNNIFNARCDEWDYLMDQFNIYSVSRLKDKEVFTLGDKVNIAGYGNNVHTINRIYLSNNQLFVDLWTEYDKNYSGYSIMDIKKIVKSPLFTTQDKVDIYEGDSWWWVNTKESSYPSYKTFKVNQVSERQIPYYFSTEEAANEYVIMNKPCLSLKEICKSLEKNPYSWSSLQLRELVKSRI